MPLRPPAPVLLRSSALASSLAAVLSLLALQCPAPSDDRPRALVAPDRRDHLLARPFPSDELRHADGGVDLSSLPQAATPLGQRFLDGWIAQARSEARGFSALTPIFFRFDGDPGVDGSHPGSLLDPVLLLSLDSLELVPIRARFVADSRGDPYLPDGTLVVTPSERHPLRSGERYLALVSTRVARPAAGWAPPAEVPGLAAAVATVFTVQDPAAELEALRVATDSVLDRDPSLLEPTQGLRRVVSLRFEPGETVPSGVPATLEIVRYADGGTRTTFLEASDFPAREIDLDGGPMEVFEAEIRTVAFQDPTGRPYQTPGLGIVTDTTRTDGWIRFGPDGTPLRAPHPEPMRIVVQVPRSGRGLAVVDWSHGSGGDAYESVARVDPGNDLAAIRSEVARRGGILLGGDLPLLGRRFDTIDRGYRDTLVIVNPPNLVAFRDNVRQGVVDMHVRFRFAREVLPGLLEPGRVDPGRVAAFGHSIGAQIAGVALGLGDGGPAPERALLNGTGGFVIHSVLASDLLQLEGDLAAAIFALAGITPPPDATPAQVLAALFGLPEAAWPNLDRHHPATLPFQILLDGADPLPVAREHDTPVEVFAGEGDTQVPPEGFAWLTDAADAELTTCAPRSDYNGHVCVFREPEGLEAFGRLVPAP